MASAPEFADEVEHLWRLLPDTTWGPLAFAILDRMVRENVAKCFRRAGRELVATRLADLPVIVDQETWSTAASVVHDAEIIIPLNTQEMDALTACYTISTSVDDSLIMGPTDCFLKEVSLTAFIVARTTGGTARMEMRAQSLAIHRELERSE